MKITHPKDSTIFVNISTRPIGPVNPAQNSGESKSCIDLPDFEKMFQYGGLPLKDLIAALEKAALQGFTHIEFNEAEYDYSSDAIFLKKGPSQEQIDEYEAAFDTYQKAYAKWDNELIDAQKTVRIMYEEKTQKLKDQREKEKNSDPRYIEYVRLFRELRKDGYL